MRILMLSPHPSVRGPLPKHTPLLVASLRELGCEVDVEPWGRHSETEGPLAKLFGRMGDVLRLRKIILRGEYDVVVVKTAHDYATLARDICLVTSVQRRTSRLVVQLHGSQAQRLAGPGDWPFRTATRLLASRCDAVLLLSSEEEREWRSFYPTCSYHVVANPFRPDPGWQGLKRRSADPTDQLRILYCGRLLREKGVFDLLEAVGQLDRSLPWSLVLAGAGPASGQLEQMAFELGIADRVSLVGYLQGDSLAQLYVDSDVLVLPTYWYEGFPTVISEAMGLGLPIVTTRTRGVADHLVEGENALFVAARDSRALCSALSRVLVDSQLREDMAEANRAEVLKFDPSLVARGYLDVLERVVAQPAARDA